LVSLQRVAKIPPGVGEKIARLAQDEDYDVAFLARNLVQSHAVDARAGAQRK
jgi:hypothetical protein